MKTNNSLKLIIFLTISVISNFIFSQKLQPYVLIVQPIVLQSDEGTEPASMALPEELVDRVYEKAGVDFYFLEAIYFNNTKARDGKINLDEIIRESIKKGIIKGNGDIVNMFFVNSVDGNKGPLGRARMGGSNCFICLGEGNQNDPDFKNMQAFVIAHEIGHNLSLKHVVDDPNIPDNIPNIEGSGAFSDRIDPKYSLTDYQIDIIHKSPLVHPRVDFLSKIQGENAILDETFEAYFSLLQEPEISAFISENVSNPNIETSRSYARSKFSSAVVDFTPDEKECINYVVNRVNTTLLDNNLETMANHPWRFIKIEDWLCGGFAHTRGTYIILSQKHIDHLSKTWNNNMTTEEEATLVKNFGALIVHEQLHSIQRTFKSKFTDLYTNYWNFTLAENIENDTSIQKIQVSNPDAPIAEWLIPSNSNTLNYYWVRTLLKECSDIPVMGKDFTDKVFILNKYNDSYRLQRDSYGKPKELRLTDINFYTESFPVSRGIDHPNEISAYMFSDYFVSLITNKQSWPNQTESSTKNAKLFIDWIKNEM